MFSSANFHSLVIFLYCFFFRLGVTFTNEFSDYQLICFFCSEIISESNINSICYLNRMDHDIPINCTYFSFIINNLKSIISVQGYTEKTPKFKHRGNDRHYFHKPKKEFLQIKQNLPPKISDFPSAEKLYKNLFIVFSKYF